MDTGSEEPELGQNDAERWLERYLRNHGYRYDYEPDLGIEKRPDFVIERDGVRVVCEVKGFETPPALERRLEGTTQAVNASSDEVYGPMRAAVREAARQLKPLAGSELPLVVILANPLGYYVHLDMDALIEAMFGNPGWAGKFDAAAGQVEELEFEYGRDGRLRNDHPYISAVAILREVDLERESQQTWREEWKKGRRPVSYEDGTDALVQEIEAELAAWSEYRKSADVPSGVAYTVDVLTSGSEAATPLPLNVFDCPRDRRVDVVRESAR